MLGATSVACICISAPADLYVRFWITGWDIWRYQSIYWSIDSHWYVTSTLLSSSNNTWLHHLSQNDLHYCRIICTASNCILFYNELAGLVKEVWFALGQTAVTLFSEWYGSTISTHFIHLVKKATSGNGWWSLNFWYGFHTTYIWKKLIVI